MTAPAAPKARNDRQGGQVIPAAQDKHNRPPTPEELQKFWDNVSWGYQ